jgi:hypothetical protein
MSCNSGEIQLGFPNASNSALVLVKQKVKFLLEQAMKAQRGSRGITLLFL